MVSGCLLFRGSFALKSHVGSLDLVRCPESRSVHFSEVTITMLNSIGNTALVRYREVVRFSEGPLSEARLYVHVAASLITDSLIPRGTAS